MPTKFSTKIGERDIEILTALDRTPLTPRQLCHLSQSFARPFHDEHNLRRRLRRLVDSDLIRSFPYALISEGRAPAYFKLTRQGYRTLYGQDVRLPNRRYFEEVSHGHHHHTFALAESIVHLITSGSKNGVTLNSFARENSVQLKTNATALYPDCAFQITGLSSMQFNFCVELDNGTERVRTNQDVESLERKMRGYDAHQSQFDADDPRRYLVLLITTRSKIRLQHMLDAAAAVMKNPQRTVFLGCDLSTLLAGNPFHDAVFRDHRGLKRTLIPNAEWKNKKSATLVPSVATL